MCLLMTVHNCGTQYSTELFSQIHNPPSYPPDNHLSNEELYNLHTLNGLRNCETALPCKNLTKTLADS